MANLPVAGGPSRNGPGALADRYGRIATDLRVSLTDRCNLRCTYCMPAQGLPWLPAPDLLTDDEVIRLIGVAVRFLGITEVRFTGGEPLLRPGLVAIVEAAGSLTPRPELSLTTNGIGLRRQAERLAAAGLDRVNVSLDTLDKERFAALTRRSRLPEVLGGAAAAAAAGLTPVKLNALLMRGVNDDEAVPLLRYALAGGYEMRFIEQMPLGAGDSWQRDQIVAGAEILARLRESYDLLPDSVERGGAPAQTWLVAGHTTAAGLPARVGIIASVSQPFCGTCDRTRLTADGAIRSCLFSRQETDLRGALRSGACDEELARLWQTAMHGKPAGHGIDDPKFLRPARPMSAIGG